MAIWQVVLLKASAAAAWVEKRARRRGLPARGVGSD